MPGFLVGVMTGGLPPLQVSISTTSIEGSAGSTSYTSASVTTTATGGTSNFSYQWIKQSQSASGTWTANSESSSATTFTVTGTPYYGTRVWANYICRVTDNNTGRTIDTPSIQIGFTNTAMAPVVVSASGGQTNAGASTGYAFTVPGTVSVSGGSGNFTYQWYTSANTNNANWSWQTGTTSSTIWPVVNNVPYYSTASQITIFCRVTDTANGNWVDTNGITYRWTNTGAAPMSGGVNHNGSYRYHVDYYYTEFGSFEIYTSHTRDMSAYAGGGIGPYSYQWWLTGTSIDAAQWSGYRDGNYVGAGIGVVFSLYDVSNVNWNYLISGYMNPGPITFNVRITDQQGWFIDLGVWLAQGPPE